MVVVSGIIWSLRRVGQGSDLRRTRNSIGIDTSVSVVELAVLCQAGSRRDPGRVSRIGAYGVGYSD